MFHIVTTLQLLKSCHTYFANSCFAQILIIFPNLSIFTENIQAFSLCTHTHTYTPPYTQKHMRKQVREDLFTQVTDLITVHIFV